MGNLYSSFVIRPARPLAEFPQLSFVSALAVRDAVAEVVGNHVPIGLKWPNDVLADRKKLSGILIETAGLPIAAIIGIGINLVSAPAQSRWPATCLADLTNTPPPAPDDMLRLLAARLAAWVDVWEREGFRPVRRAWLDQAIGVGEMMLLRTAHEETEGRFMDLDQDGALLMQTGNGQLRRVAAGDVTPLVAVG